MKNGELLLFVYLEAVTNLMSQFVTSSYVQYASKLECEVKVS